MEADVNRRDFLKKTGGTLASVLLSKGVDPDVVKSITKIVSIPSSSAVLMRHDDIEMYNPVMRMEVADQVLKTLL